MKIKSFLANIVVVISTQISTPANAFDGWLDIHLGSSHAQRTYMDKNGSVNEFNQNNFGLGVSLPVYSHIDARTGFFKNSFNNTSVYAGSEFYLNTSRFIRLGVNTGVVTGYDNTPTNASVVAPMLMPHVTVKVRDFRAEIGYMPALDSSHVSFWSFTIGTRF